MEIYSREEDCHEANVHDQEEFKGMSANGSQRGEEDGAKGNRGHGAGQILFSGKLGGSERLDFLEGMQQDEDKQRSSHCTVHNVDLLVAEAGDESDEIVLASKKREEHKLGVGDGTSTLGPETRLSTMRVNKAPDEKCSEVADGEEYLAERQDVVASIGNSPPKRRNLESGICSTEESVP